MSEQVPAVTAVLEDGGQVHIRPADAGDKPALAGLYGKLGGHGGHLRSSGSRGDFAADAAREAAALVPIGQSLTAWANHELVGVASYQNLESPREATVAVAVTSRWQGRGVGTLLLEHLISRARQQGIESFHADVPADNTEMLGVLDDLGLGDSCRRAQLAPGARAGVSGGRRCEPT